MRIRSIHTSALGLLVALGACADDSKTPAKEIKTPEAFVQHVIEQIVPTLAGAKVPAMTYVTREPLAATDTIKPVVGDSAFKPQDRYWFAFVDLQPLALFAHPVKFVFTDARTGKTTIEDHEWWPELNGTGFSVSKAKLVKIFASFAAPAQGAPPKPTASGGGEAGAPQDILWAFYPDYTNNTVDARLFFKLPAPTTGTVNLAIDLDGDGAFKANEWMVKGQSLAASSSGWGSTEMFSMPLDSDKKFPNQMWARLGVFSAATSGTWDGSCTSGACSDAFVGLDSWRGPCRTDAALAAATPGIAGPAAAGGAAPVPAPPPVPSAKCQAKCQPDDISFETACKALVISLGDNPGQAMMHWDIWKAFNFYKQHLGEGSVGWLKDPTVPAALAAIENFVKSIQCMDEAHLFIAAHGYPPATVRAQPGFESAQGGVWVKNNPSGLFRDGVLTVKQLDEVIAKATHCPKTMDHYANECRQPGYCNLNLTITACYSGNFVTGSNRLDLDGINILTAANTSLPGWGYAGGDKAGTTVANAYRAAFDNNPTTGKNKGDANGDGVTTAAEAMKYAVDNYEGKGVTDGVAAHCQESKPQMSAKADCNCVCDSTATLCSLIDPQFGSAIALGGFLGLTLTPEMCMLLAIAEIVHSALGVALKVVAHDHTTILAWFSMSPLLKLALLQKLFHNTDFPCGAGLNGYTLCAQPETPPVEGDYIVLHSVLEKPVPLQDPTNHYQYAFVFDADGVTTNNYQPGAQYPNDFFKDTDRWYAATYTPSAGWELKVTDASGGGTVNVTGSSARMIIKDNTIMLVVPRSEFTAAKPKFRITAFRHTGDYGITPPHNWDGSVWPAVADGLQAMP